MAGHRDRAHALLSASSSARWIACTKSAIAESKEPNETTPFAEEGTHAHEVAEAIARGQSVQPSDIYTEEMIRHAFEYGEYIEEHTTEDSIVMLEQRLDFSHWVPDGFGTGDCIIIEDKHLTIIDYKYGAGVPVSAKDNSQMRLYALGALNDYGAVYEIEKITMAIFQPRLHNISEEEIETVELLNWADNVLKPAADLAYSGKGEYKAGPHCKFCKHAGKCRTLATTCASVFTLNGKKQTVENLAPWEYDEILRMQPLIELWLKRVNETVLQKLMAGEEIPGQKLVEGRSSRKWSNPGEVEEKLSWQLPEHRYKTTPELLSVAALEKEIGKAKVAELVGPYIVKAPGKIGIAPAEDKRPAYNPAGEFDKLED